MQVMFASGDVGGARALTPVAELMAKGKHKIIFSKNGAVLNEYPSQSPPWIWSDKSDDIKTIRPDVFIFSSSLTDNFALELAVAAQKYGIPTIHLLDNWSNYTQRLITEDGYLFTPKLYLVMDEFARDGAIEAGIDPKILRITGTPALESINSCSSKIDGDLLFISEPVSSDQGISPSDKSYRGYCEKSVLQMVLKLRRELAPELNLKIKLHPRESTSGLLKILGTNYDSQRIFILPPDTDHINAFENTRCVIGMSSLLLYRAWLAGLPCLSLQPNLKINALRYLENKEGLLFVDSYEGFKLSFFELLALNRKEIEPSCVDERKKHSAASQTILKLINAVHDAK